MTDPLGLIGPVGRPAMPAPPRAPGETQGPSFQDVLKANVDQVNRLQQDAEMAIEDLVSGRRDDVGKVLIAKEKADMTFQMLLQVRNKLADAYEEIKQVRV